MSKLRLAGERIHLKDLAENISPQTILHYFSDIDQYKYIYMAPYPYTEEDAKMFFRYLDNIKNDASMNELGIFKNEDNSFVGVVSLNSIDNHDKNAELGYWIVKEFWGQGYAMEAARLVINYAFDNLKLNKIYANLQKENVPSLMLLSKLGFQVEGLMRKQVCNKGEFVDRYFCGLLKEDYDKIGVRI